MENSKFILSVLVRNESGVLTRVSSLFSRRGFNIDSLSVGETETSEFSRITISSKGDEYTKEQIVKQLMKLEDVITVELMNLENTVLRELLLVKVKFKKGELTELMQAISVFRAKVIDLMAGTATLELTGQSSKVNAFIEFLVPYGIVELCRTGITAIGRGEYILNNNIKEK
jgi:acetolactate synthase, small subunit